MAVLMRSDMTGAALRAGAAAAAGGAGFRGLRSMAERVVSWRLVVTMLFEGFRGALWKPNRSPKAVLLDLAGLAR